MSNHSAEEGLMAGSKGGFAYVHTYRPPIRPHHGDTSQIRHHFHAPKNQKSTRLQAAEKLTVDLTVASQGQTHGRSIKSPPRLRGFAYLRLSLRHSQRKNLPRRVTGRRAHCGVLPVVEITSNR